MQLMHACLLYRLEEMLQYWYQKDFDDPPRVCT
jgi:hypothetical protein